MQMLIFFNKNMLFLLRLNRIVQKMLQMIYKEINFVKQCCFNQNKKEEIWLSPMTKALAPTENENKQSDHTKSTTKCSITQRQRTDLKRSNYSNHTSVVKPSTDPAFPLPETSV